MGRLLNDCSDGRFLNVEKRLFRALGYYLKCGKIGSISVPKISSKANIWKSTFYDHFKNLDDAISQYDHQYDQDVKKLFDEITCERVNTELAFSKILYFIGKNKEYYSTYLYRQNLNPFFDIAKKFRPVLAQGWSNYGREKYDLCFKIFCGEMFGVLFFWGNSENFDNSKIKEHATYLSYLAQNATKRLF